MKLKTLILAIAALALLFTGCTSETGTSVPEGMKLFSSENVDYTAYVPEDWTVDMSTGTLSAYVSSLDASNISITASVLEDVSMTLDEYWEGYENDFKLTFDDMEYVGDHPVTTTLDGLAANKYVYTATVTGMQYKFMQLICINSGAVYVITYTSVPDKYDEHIDDIDDIISNFTFD